ncbi:YciI family protein [Paracoccus alkanivorans]|uniref:YciI family protein n=1 Tax=Paracoccus alkanivorans TaxID=2116655 RepID=A0A3M0MK95_9RHOB|nr:YciI family protein [Paracoccus alkanivorans]RMC36050.1 YciI family protein [Paracoccus alkanivorans]
MLYAILCYHDENVTSNWSAEHDAAVIARLKKVHGKWADQFKPIARLMPSSSATTLRKSDGMVLDGPYAETKEQLLGFYIVDIRDLDQGLQIARDLTEANPGGVYELRPIMGYYPDGAAAAHDTDP